MTKQNKETLIVAFISWVAAWMFILAAELIFKFFRDWHLFIICLIVGTLISVTIIVLKDWEW